MGAHTEKRSATGRDAHGAARDVRHEAGGVQRTLKQNASLHKYLRELAEAMADAGYDMREAIHVPIRPTPENVKETMWRAVQRAMFPGVESTTQLTTVQMQEVYKQLDYFTGERFGIHVEWPCEESLSEAQRE